ncbi:unnamed protein product [Caenorhabditis angaria]|uniref:Uncharacterized protein n=1 Tax=Caenorhabditis angaria TaxID=860376 RepID=A0A9P1N0V2_9PELO|nr:unnamed protein product [Caenorhabditis angaria]
MSIKAEIDALKLRLLEFQGKSHETTEKLLEMDGNVDAIVNHAQTLKTSLKTLKIAKSEEEELNAALHFELEQLHDREKLEMLKLDEAEALAAKKLREEQEDVKKRQERCKIELEAIHRELKVLAEQVLID